MTLLASMDPNAAQWVGALALALFGIAGGMNQVAALIDRWRGKPANEQLAQSADVLSARIASLETNLQMRPTAESVKTSVDALGHRMAHLEGHRESDDRIASSQRARLYDEIKTARAELSTEVAEVRKELTDHVEQVRRELARDMKDLAHQIGNTPAETVALLRNTGVIK